MKKYKVGEIYRYSELPENTSEDITLNEYGDEYIGQNAIHIRVEKTETDIWFIYHGQGNEGFLKCVYNQ